MKKLSQWLWKTKVMGIPVIVHLVVPPFIGYFTFIIFT